MAGHEEGYKGKASPFLTSPQAGAHNTIFESWLSARLKIQMIFCTTADEVFLKFEEGVSVDPRSSRESGSASAVIHSPILWELIFGKRSFFFAFKNS